MVHTGAAGQVSTSETKNGEKSKKKLKCGAYSLD
jgi:hypothetical protein